MAQAEEMASSARIKSFFGWYTPDFRAFAVFLKDVLYSVSSLWRVQKGCGGLGRSRDSPTVICNRSMQS
jgi:hypothetical protein